MKRTLENVEHYTWGINCDGWHLLKTGSLSVIQERMPSDRSEQLHCHRFSQQLFYILSGTATFEIKGQKQIISANESIHIPPRTLHAIANREKEDLSFLVISEPKSHGDRIEIVEYTEELKEPIKMLNIEWLEKYFKVEPIDELLLSNPKKEIIDKGGLIFYARYNHEIVGTVTLLKVENEIYELGKMAVKESFQGLGIGNILIDHSLIISRQIGAKRLILYSNTILKSAIHIYKKYGFTEVTLETGHYQRANIKMEKIL